MSVQRVHTIKKAQKDQGKCMKCGVELPVGSGYLWWTMGFRAKYRYKRCLKPTCFPRPSERETSKAVTILAAQEAFMDNIETLDNKDDIESAVQEVGSAVREVTDEYQEALDQWENGNEQIQEKVDHYEGQVDEIENWTYEGDGDWELCEEHNDGDPDDEGVLSCEKCSENRDAWLEEVREAAREAVDSVEIA